VTVEEMLATDGVYVLGDTDHPGAYIVVLVIQGTPWSTKLDEPLDPRRFKSTATISGPHRPPLVAPTTRTRQ
jgi:hypothetical protein